EHGLDETRRPGEREPFAANPSGSVAAAENPRSEEYRHAIHAAGAEELPERRRPAFDEEARDAVARQFSEQPRDAHVARTPAVRAPTRMASCSSRRSRARSRASRPVIQRLRPPAAAVLPSSVAAHLAVTNGRRSAIQRRNFSFWRSARCRRAGPASSTATPP